MLVEVILSIVDVSGYPVLIILITLSKVIEEEELPFIN